MPHAGSAREAYESLGRDDLLSCLAGQRVFFYGSAYMRDVYRAVAELLLGRELTARESFVPAFDEELVFGPACTLNPSGKKVTMVRAPGSSNEIACVMADREVAGCGLPGPAGVDLAKCGSPHNRSITVPGFDLTLHFQYKSYLFTEEADQAVRNYLADESFDLTVLGSSEWGRNQYLDSELDHAAQAAAFLDPLFKIVPGLKALVYHSYNRSSKAIRAFVREKIRQGDESSVVFDLDRIKPQVPNPRVRLGEPENQVLARTLTTALCRQIRGRGAPP